VKVKAPQNEHDMAKVMWRWLSPLLTHLSSTA